LPAGGNSAASGTANHPQPPKLQSLTSKRSRRAKSATTSHAQDGQPQRNQPTRYDAALVRCIDFERQFSKLPTDTQTLLLLASREKQPQRVIAQITGWSPRALSDKLPAALVDLARLLDQADLL